MDNAFDNNQPAKQRKKHEALSNELEIKKMKLLDKLEILISITRGSQLEDSFIKEHKLLIQSVADDLSLTPKQTVLLCPFIDSPFSVVDFGDLEGYFRCGPITIMKNRSDIKALLHRRYICGCGSYRRSRSNSFQLTEKAQNLLCDNKGMPVIKTTGLTPIEFMQTFRSLVYDSENLQQIGSEELIQETIELLDENPQLEIVKAIDSLKLCDDEKFVILSFCKKFLMDNEDGVPLDYFDDNIENYFEFRDEMISGLHPFIREGLLSPLGRDNLFNRDVFGLTEKACCLFLNEYELPKREIKQQNISNAKLITSHAIKPKPLFYCAEDQEQIDTLQGLLGEKQLKAIRKRLEAANLRKGFNCLFYGLPGTGKTETALQLARSTGRDIMQVDISTMRDKWYGETEKIVKGIFDDYDCLVKQSKRIPILLINEADALLSVRTSIGGTNPTLEKTENAIQNILLESMENLDGIMIATTNLTCNLDSAFDRRFLYKVEFHQPSIEAKTNIWKSFLPSLNEESAEKLARSFDFSGGQIENITRKVMVDHLLFGNKPDLKRLMELCSTEQLSGRSNKRTPIGYH